MRSMNRHGITTMLISILLLGVFIPSVYPQTSLTPLKVCATVTDLGDLAREIGGDQVAVTVFAKGKEDPHSVEAKPSFIKTLSQADLFLQIGMELEIGWVPVLLQHARNSKVLPGARGYLDASKTITALEVPTGIVDRSMGDVHPQGNPHYLLDPLNGLRVAQRIKEKLIELRPEKRPFFEERYAIFYRTMGEALIGEKLNHKYGFEKLANLFENKLITSFLQEQGEEGGFGGWLGMMLPHQGSKVVADHNMWPYFARRFGVSVVGFLEPKPGISPTTKHLQALVEKMKAEGIRVVLSSPYFDIRHAHFVSRHTGAKIVPLAHQVGARPGTDTYIHMIDYNVRQLAGAF